MSISSLEGSPKRLQRVRITSGDGWAGSGFAVMAVLWEAEGLWISVEGRAISRAAILLPPCLFVFTRGG